MYVIIACLCSMAIMCLEGCRIRCGQATHAEQQSVCDTELQAVLPVLREMGEEKGHVRQDALVTRLALIAAGPWRNIAPRSVCTYQHNTFYIQFSGVCRPQALQCWLQDH